MEIINLAFDYICDRITCQKYQIEKEENIKNKIVLITGANSGLGKYSAYQMAKRGAQVIMACRSLKRGVEALESIKKKVPEAQLYLFQLDLEDLDSIHKFASIVKETFPHINILLNNAGIEANEKNVIKKTKHNFELHFGVNHLGPFLLTTLLIDLLIKGAPFTRIVMLSSTMHLVAKLNLNDLNLEKMTLNSMKDMHIPYSNSKLANALFAKELALKLKGSGVKTYSLCPGLVRTNIYKNHPFIIRTIYHAFFAIFGLSVKKGCETVLTCCLSKDYSNDSGNMYRFNKKWDKADKLLNEMGIIGEELWAKSEDLVNLKFKII